MGLRAAICGGLQVQVIRQHQRGLGREPALLQPLQHGGYRNTQELLHFAILILGLHAMRHRYQALILRQTFLVRFRRHGVVVLEKGRWENTFCFCQGKLLWRKEGDLAPEWLAAEPALDEWQIIDRAGVIWQWLQQERSGGEAAVIDQRWKNIMTWSNDHRTAIFMPAVLDANSLVR